MEFVAPSLSRPQLIVRIRQITRLVNGSYVPFNLDWRRLKS